ncbi:MAG: response regulator transcription factor, partial [Polyangiaceae bacterium]
MIRVLLIDDHPMFRLGVAHYLDGTGTITVVGQADDGITGATLAASVSWDVAVIDLSLPRRGGIELLRRLVQDYPTRSAVVLSHFPEDPFAARVRREGASAFVSKTRPPDDLVKAIEAAVRTRLPGSLPPPPQAPSADKLPHEQLSPREYQVFTSLLLGRSTVQIAAELNIAASTVS